MDLRRPSVVRLDRLGSRIHSHAPDLLRSRLTTELEERLHAQLRPLEFVRAIDAFQTSLYDRLMRIYDYEPFCQLLALKLSNLAVGKYHYRHRHSVLLSKAFQLTVDPANACQLECPGCVHSSNKEYADRFDWPRTTLPVHVYEDFLERAGAWAFCALLYNYGEPLLNKRFTEIVRTSKKYLLFAMTSTNLSMPLDDAENIVASGLDRMVMSIDGTTQQVYEKYRRRGKLDLVFENARKLVAAKKKLGSSTPYLIWQFLTFEHNVHQVPDALKKARELGVNEVLVQTPFEVRLDDPAMHPVAARQQGAHRLIEWDGNWCTDDQRRRVSEIADSIRSKFEYSWERRFVETPGSDESSRSAGGTCDWLYHNLTMDGAGRIMPCCMAPDKREKHLVFANFADADAANSPMAQLARLAFADRGEYLKRASGVAAASLPYCASCKDTPLPYGLQNVAGDIRALDKKRAIPRSLRWELTQWT